MIAAAIYARKSTDQNLPDEESPSRARSSAPVIAPLGGEDLYDRLLEGAREQDPRSDCPVIAGVRCGNYAIY